MPGPEGVGNLLTQVPESVDWHMHRVWTVWTDTCAESMD